MSNAINNNVILGDLSNTQRISLKPSDSGIIIQKEHRKDSSSEWIISKGISVPRLMIPQLIQQLNTL